MVVRGVHANWRGLRQSLQSMQGFSVNNHANLDLQNNLQSLKQQNNAYHRAKMAGAGQINVQTLKNFDRYLPKNVAMADKLEEIQELGLAALKRIGGGLLDLKI